MGVITADSKRFLYVLKDGKLHEKVAEGTEGAVKRVHEADNGTITEKWELTHNGIEGTISSVSLYESDYGTNVNIEIDEFILSLKASSGYGEAFLEALPNIDLTKPVTLKPYLKKGSGRPSLFIQQDDVTIRSAFSAYNEETKEWSSLVEGYPQPDAKTKTKNTSELWKIFFSMRNEWVKDYLLAQGLITEGAVAASKSDF